MPSNLDAYKEKPSSLSEKIKEMNVVGEFLFVKDVKEFIQRRIERIKLVIKLYPHKHGEELTGQLIEDLLNDAGKELIGGEDESEI